MKITKRDGSREAFDFNKIERLNDYATRGLNVDKTLLKSQIKLLVYDGMSTREIFQAQISAAAGLISVEHPDFTFVAARYLLADTLKRVTGSSNYPSISSTVVRGIEAGRYNPDLGSGGKFDHAALDAAIKPERDFQFDYLGLQTVVDRYLTRDTNGALIELPQHFFMRVAMGLSLNEDNPTARAIEFYDALSSFDGMSSTPTLFNSATLHSQLSSCFPPDTEVMTSGGLRRIADIEVDDLVLQLDLAGLHRTAGDEDGRDVQTQSGHQHARHDLVAVRDADEGVGAVRVHLIFHGIGDDVAARQGIQHAGVAHGDAVINGHRVELARNTAGFLDGIGNQTAHFVQVHMSRQELVEGIGDGDDRLAEILAIHTGGAVEGASAREYSSIH